ncbi:UNVERIFIED_CONTAM: hypothetical protein FKN15_057714 [Acipenser sinensis]
MAQGTPAVTTQVTGQGTPDMQALGPPDGQARDVPEVQALDPPEVVQVAFAGVAAAEVGPTVALLILETAELLPLWLWRCLLACFGRSLQPLAFSASVSVCFPITATRMHNLAQYLWAEQSTKARLSERGKASTPFSPPLRVTAMTDKQIYEAAAPFLQYHTCAT